MIITQKYLICPYCRHTHEQKSIENILWNEASEYEEIQCHNCKKLFNFSYKKEITFISNRMDGLKTLTGREPLGTIGYINGKLCIIRSIMGITDEKGKLTPCRFCVLNTINGCLNDHVGVVCGTGYGSVANIYFEEYEEENNETN